MAFHDVYPTLRSHAETAWVHVALDFKPQIGAVTKLSKLVEQVEASIENPFSQILDASHYLVRDIVNQTYYVFDSKRFFCHTLGVTHWLECRDVQKQILRDALKAMQINSLTRAGFMISTSCDLGMTHEELFALMFDSFLQDKSDFEPIFGDTHDIHITIYGAHRALKSRVTLTPQTAKQASESFVNIQNLDLFVADKYQPQIVARFRDRINRDSLYIECDFWREEIAAGDLHQFTNEALDGIERVLNGSIRKIKQFGPRQVNKNG
jgi:hypothetical protein